MSKLNKKTGFYELTFSEAHRWASSRNPPRQQWTMAVFAKVLTKAGLKVVREHERWLEIDAPRPRIYLAIMNWREPSDSAEC